MKILFIITITLFLLYSCEKTDKDNSCSETNLNGDCESGKICKSGFCVINENPRAILEDKIREKLDKLDTDTDFTLKIKDFKGNVFTYNKGDSTPETFYRSASTSKLVSSTIILNLVKEGTLSLDDHPQKYISFWPTDGNLSKITLKNLLSFTSGLKTTPLCSNFGGFDFSKCVENIVSKNSDAKLSGEEFNYGSNHLQVAGLMAMNAKGITWNELFELFKKDFSLFENSKFDLPSKTNPRLAGGMHWNANEYLEFLEELYHKRLLNEELLDKMFSDQLDGATLVDSPAEAIGEEWHYGFGNWIECHSNIFNCKVTKVSSPGLYGAYPFIDFKNKYFGILAREGGSNTFTKGYEIFVNIQSELEEWATID